jgi:hypothetical protein
MLGVSSLWRPGRRLRRSPSERPRGCPSTGALRVDRTRDLRNWGTAQRHKEAAGWPFRSLPNIVAEASGLSAAYHLAKELRARKLGSGADVLVLDKSSPGSGASGIACGVVRNNYFQPAMSELMQACVEVWESDPEAYAYNPVGYVALGAAVQEPDLIAVAERQERIGYRSEVIVGEADVDAHGAPFRLRPVTVCLHERRRFVFNIESVSKMAVRVEGDD